MPALVPCSPSWSLTSLVIVVPWSEVCKQQSRTSETRRSRVRVKAPVTVLNVQVIVARQCGSGLWMWHVEGGGRLGGGGEGGGNGGGEGGGEGGGGEGGGGDGGGGKGGGGGGGGEGGELLIGGGGGAPGGGGLGGGDGGGGLGGGGLGGGLGGGGAGGGLGGGGLGGGLGGSPESSSAQQRTWWRSAFSGQK